MNELILHETQSKCLTVKEILLQYISLNMLVFSLVINFLIVNVNFRYVT